VGERRNACKILVRKSEGKITPWTGKRRSEDNIKMDLKEASYDGADWAHLLRIGDIKMDHKEIQHVGVHWVHLVQ
jgi:hypothetical protein